MKRSSVSRLHDGPPVSRSLVLRIRKLGWTGIAWALAACAVNPATGEREISLVSEGQEIEMGRSADPAATAEFGGLYPDDGLQAYVRGLGGRLAAESERPQLPWSFKLVNHDLINAFALPGGFIYITRGILAHMNSEAELAAVLGHEIGHVTARHSASQITRQQLGTIGILGGAIFSETIRENADAAIFGMQLVLLRYGRDAEREADELGFRYMTRTRHHPEGMTHVMETLQSTSGGDSGATIPSWLSSHPDPGDRLAANQQRIAQSGESFSGYEIGRERFLESLDGLVFGEDPREGFLLGHRFVHPTLRFEITFPRGWTVANGAQAVQAMSAEQDAASELTFAEEETPAAALGAFSSMEGVQMYGEERGSVNGLEARGASFTIETEQGEISGQVRFVAFGGQVYRLLGYAGAERWSTHSPAVRGWMGTFEALGANEFQDARPHRVRIVELGREMTGAEFLRTHPSTVSDEEVLLANGVEASERLPRGQLMKQIVEGNVPDR